MERVDKYRLGTRTFRLRSRILGRSAFSGVRRLLLIVPGTPYKVGSLLLDSLVIRFDYFLHKELKFEVDDLFLEPHKLCPIKTLVLPLHFVINLIRMIKDT